MNVPRGTVRHAVLPPWQRAAAAGGMLSVLRWPVTAENSTVHPGSFEGLDLESGRARRAAGGAELRARCRFESGAVRAVTVTPEFQVGDLYWIRGDDRVGARKNSKLTLDVSKIHVRRLQDMTDEDARAAGAQFVPEELKVSGTERTWFQRTQPTRWAANPWVWVVSVTVHRENIDELLSMWAEDGP